MQISVHADMKSAKRGIFQQQTSKITQSWSNQFCIPIANVSVTLQLVSVRKPKSDNSQFPIILMVVKTFSASCFFWITV